jgi:hypothetical protein
MIKHGLSKHPLYKTWNNVTQRVKTNKFYIHVDICEEWLTFINFYDWSIKNGWAKNLTIDRIDSKGNYEPNNCRWVSMEVQNRNTKRNRYYEYNNEILVIQDICEKYNINRNTFNKRFGLGWSIEKIIETPVLDLREIRLGTKLSDETKLKIKEALKGNNNRIKNRKNE